jgi:hypothetical protein
MAIDFDLEMATPLPGPQVAVELCDVARTFGLFDEAVTPEQILEEGARTRSDLWVRVLDVSPDPRNPVAEDLGFIPTVRVAFRLGKFTDMSAQQDDMIRIVSHLLDRVPGDAVLHFQYEYIWLLRRGGELSLNERSDIWPPQRLAAVRQPYRRATYAFD